MLAKSIQIRNQRKVKVNAQVTFVIYVLETVANLSIFIVWIFIHGYSSEVTVTMGVMWFHVILPYIFLMNTSHNKNLLIDDGWWNTVKNAIGIPFSNNNEATECQPISLSVINTTRRSAIETWDSKQRHGDKNTNEINIGHPNLSPNRKRSRRNRKNNENSDIFTVSNVDHFPQCSTSSVCIDSTSLSTCHTIIEKYVAEALPNKQINSNTKETSDSDEENQPPLKNYHLEVGESLLGKMANVINNELEYLHYLTQLSQLEDQFIKNQGMSELKGSFRIIEYPTKKKGKVKSKKSRSEKSFSSVTSKNDLTSTNEVNVNLLGKALDRQETRRLLLTNYQEYCNDNESYKSFCDALFDFEENLIFNYESY